MQTNHFEPTKFEEVFTHAENILQCGVYVNVIKNEQIQWSRGMYTLLGLEPFSVTPNNEIFLKYISEDDVPTVMAAIEESKLTKKPYQIEFCMIDANGLERRMYAENYMIYDDNGQSARIQWNYKRHYTKLFSKKTVRKKN